MNAPALQIHLGTCLSPGFGVGPLHVGDPLSDCIDGGILGNSCAYDADEESWRLDQAALGIPGDLLSLAERVEKEIDAKLAQVFSVHHLLLEDTSPRAGRAEQVPRLLERGIRSLGVAPPLVPAINETIRGCAVEGAPAPSPT
jgi:phosphoenolpyruvate-protein kinase (PTS system EI component)